MIQAISPSDYRILLLCYINIPCLTLQNWTNDLSLSSKIPLKTSFSINSNSNFFRWLDIRVCFNSCFPLLSASLTFLTVQKSSLLSILWPQLSRLCCFHPDSYMWAQSHVLTELLYVRHLVHGLEYTKYRNVLAIIIITIIIVTIVIGVIIVISPVGCLRLKQMYVSNLFCLPMFSFFNID